MTRALRLEEPGAIWHLMGRGNERGDILRSDRDRRRFFEILAEVIELHRWVVSAYPQMSNNYQLLIETAHPALSVGARLLNERNAPGFNIDWRASVL